MYNFGQFAQHYYNLQRLPDVSVNMLGYWTDNGAYYFFYDFKNIMRDGVPEVVLEKLSSSLRQQGLPVSYYQLDAWWYTWSQQEQKNGDGMLCTMNWTPNSTQFPHGSDLSPSKLNSLRSFQQLSEAIGPLH